MKIGRFSSRLNKGRHLRVGSTLAISLTCATGYCDTPTGLIGGVTNSSEAYSAYISSDGTLTSISGLPLTGQINAVHLNGLGTGLIGGQNNGDGYAAFVSPSGAVNTLILNSTAGAISTTSINNDGNGLIGGDASFNMYAALVSADGTVSPLFTGTLVGGFIHSTALNDDGIGLIGGEGNTFPYAAYVTPGGVVNVIDSGTLSGGHFSVAINDLGNGIIGLGSLASGAYAAFVTPGSSTPSPLSPLPSGVNAFITSVAINNSGIGLIGGNDYALNMYAGYSTPTGVVTPLFTSLDPGQITSVALNSSGTGLIGGQSNSNLYAAFVDPSGQIKSVILAPPSGTINSVAINDAGVGLIGGQEGSNGYAALVAPNGALTLLDMTGLSNITSVALLEALDATTPQSIGPYSSGFYTQLAASATLQSRFIEQNRVWTKGNTPQASVAQLDYREKSLLAQNSPDIPWVGKADKKDKSNTLWIAPFGNYVHSKAEEGIPGFTNAIGGLLLGYDYHDTNYIVGTSAGYAFNYIGYSQKLGHSKLQEEMVSLYGA